MDRNLIIMIVTAVLGILYTLLPADFPLVKEQFVETIVYIVLAIFFGGSAAKRSILKKQGKY